MTVLIKNFGNNARCSTLKELKKVLKEKYLNTHIAIAYTLDSGIKQIAFVKVLNDCTLIDSSDHQIVKLSSFGLL